MVRTLLVAALLAVPLGATAQYTRTCLPDLDDGQGLQVAVDAAGRTHLLRVRVLGGDLRYTRIDADGATVTETVATRISRLGIDEVDNPHLALWDGEPAACFYDASGQRMRFAERTGDGTWAVSDLAVGGRDGCRLVAAGADRWVVWAGAAGDLRAARRTGPATWAEEQIAAEGGTAAALDAEALSDGRLVVAFGDDTGALNIAERAVGGGWSLDFTYPFSGGWGSSPAIAVDGATYTVLHGLTPGDSDSGGIRTSGTPWARASEIHLDGALGGDLDARTTGWGETIATRLYSRSALFGQTDGLYLYPAVGARTTLAFHSQADQRHRYESVGLASDPFGEPVVAAFDQRSPFMGLEAGGFTCVWTPDDTDGDAVPDVVEGRLGTDPDVADSDGDGRTDGEELLIDDTDPLVGPPPPDVLLPAGPADQDADGVLTGESNLVTDGDLEGAVSWLRYGASACVRAEAAAGQGAFGMRCGPGGGGIRAVQIPIVSGTNYRVRFAHRLTSGVLYAFVGTTANGAFAGLPGASVTRSDVGGWAWSERVVRAPADVGNGLALYVLATGEADLDAVSVVEVPSDGSALANGDLSVPGGAGWFRYGATGCEVVGSQFVCTGRRGVQQVSLPVGPGETWRFRMQLRRRSGYVLAYLGVDDPEQGFVTLPGGLIRRVEDGNADWASVERVLALPSALSGPVRLVIYVNGDADLADIDLTRVHAGENVLVDGDFESPTSLAWWRAWASGCTRPVDSTQVLACGGVGQAVEQFNVALQPDTTYRMDLRYQLSAGSAGVQLAEATEAGDRLLPGTTFGVTSGDGLWTTRSVTFRTPSTFGPLRVLVYGSGDARLDDLSISAVGDLSDAILDGSFESDDDTGWTRYASNACQVQAGDAYQGARALVCAPGSQQLRLALTPGRTYRLQIAWKNDAGSAWGYLGVRGADNGYTLVPGTALQTSTADSEWTVHDRVFVAPDPGDGVFQVVLVANGQTRFDAISITPVD